jgi:hypothetical protein
MDTSKVYTTIDDPEKTIMRKNSLIMIVLGAVTTILSLLPLITAGEVTLVIISLINIFIGIAGMLVKNRRNCLIFIAWQ